MPRCCAAKGCVFYGKNQRGHRAVHRRGRSAEGACGRRRFRRRVHSPYPRDDGVFLCDPAHHARRGAVRVFARVFGFQVERRYRGGLHRPRDGQGGRQQGPRGERPVRDSDSRPESALFSRGADAHRHQQKAARQRAFGHQFELPPHYAEKPQRAGDFQDPGGNRAGIPRIFAEERFYGDPHTQDQLRGRGGRRQYF